MGMMFDMKEGAGHGAAPGAGACAGMVAPDDLAYPAIGSLRFLVLAGTQSGNALLVAEVLSERLSEAGARRLDILPEGHAPDPRLPGIDVLLVCVATHGDGELPDAFMPIFEDLRSAAPDLANLRYGLVALGDRTYKQFCGGGQRVDALLTALGAKRIGDICEIDASSQPFPDEDAVTWLQQWLKQL